MQYDVRLEKSSGPPTAIVRRRATKAELARVVPDACGVVWREIRAQGIKGAGRHIALYLDCGAAEQINLEVGVELDAPISSHGELIASALPIGTVATTTHFGPYQQLAAAHQAIRTWCASQGHAHSGPNWEIYGHWDDSWNNDPSKIRTDVFYLLAK